MHTLDKSIHINYYYKVIGLRSRIDAGGGVRAVIHPYASHGCTSSEEPSNDLSKGA